jgi:outer membrane protein assembly factor BamA
MLRILPFKILLRCMVLFFLPATIPTSAPAQQIPKSVALAKVEYQGLTLFTPAEINAVAGLKIGQHIDSSDLDNAAKILTYWGYFRTVQYNYRHNGTQMTLAFQVGENSKLSDCIFDNFVGFSDQELMSAIQKELPSFKGIVPESGTVLQDIAKSLEKYISRKEIRKSVSASAVYDSSRKGQTIVFSIDNFKPPMCIIDFDGEDKEILSLLEQASLKLINTPYSRWRINSYSRQDLSAFLQKHGYWKFGVLSIAADKMNAPDCAEGSRVKVNFASGGKYTWSGATWSGNSIKSASELNSLMGINPGDVAGRQAIEAGMMNIASAYLKNGYLDYRLLGAQPGINGYSHQINYQVEIKEGGQYRMGAFFPFHVPGLSLPVDKLVRQWQLKRGDIFDAVYFEEFKEKYFKPWCKAYAPNAGLMLSYVANRNTMNADIFVAPPPPPPPGPKM